MAQIQYVSPKGEYFIAVFWALVRNMDNTIQALLNMHKDKVQIFRA